MLAENECATNYELSKTLTDYTETQTYIRAYREADVKTQRQLNKSYADWTATLEQRKREAAAAEQKRLEEERLAEEKRLADEAAAKVELRDKQLIDELLAAVGAKDFDEVVLSKVTLSTLKQYKAILSSATKDTIEKIKLLEEMQELYRDCRKEEKFFAKNRNYTCIR